MKNIVLLLAMLAAILGLASCHTTEANYKAAYDKAVEKTRENMGEDNYAHMQAARMAYTEVVNGDSVRLLRSCGQGPRACRPGGTQSSTAGQR